MQKYKFDILFFVSIAAFVVLFYFLADIILPFFIGLFLAYLCSPLIKKIQFLIANRNLAVVVFLFTIIITIGGAVFLLAAQISNDFHRLNNAFVTFADTNKDKLDETTKTISGFIEKIYSPEELKEALNLNVDADSLSLETISQQIELDSLSKKLDIGAIKSALTSIGSFFSSEEKEPESTSSGLSWITIFFTSIIYFLYILFEFTYFENVWKKYFSQLRSNKISKVFDDFKITFLQYFKQRSKLVILLTVFYITSFFIIGVPGALILGIIVGLLCYVPYLQYIGLIPLSLGCVVLSMETDHNFFIYFGIVLAVLVVASVLEETILYEKIMKKAIRINSVVMILAIAVWSYLLGMIGILIAIPLTTLIISYVKMLLTSYYETVSERSAKNGD